MVDAPPCDVGDVEQSIDAAEVHKGSVIGDVLDHAIDNLAFLKAGDQFRALRGAGFLEHSAARDHDVAALAVHLEDLELMGRADERRDVPHRANIHLACRQERRGTRQVHRIAALDTTEDDAGDALVVAEGLLELVPRLLPAGLFPTQHRLAVFVLHTLDIDVDHIADLDLGRLARLGEFLQRHPPLGFEPDVDQRHVVLDVDHDSFDDPALEALGIAQGLLEQLGKILAGRWDVLDGRRARLFGHSASFQFPIVPIRPAVAPGGSGQSPTLAPRLPAVVLRTAQRLTRPRP